MIVGMKKVSLVILDETKKESLKQLRKIGLIHPETLEGSGPVLAAFKDSLSKTEKAQAILDELKIKKNDVPKNIKISDNSKVIQKCDEIISLCERKKSLFDKIAATAQELDRFTKWGSVNPEDFVYLSEKNLFLYMYEIPSDKYGLITKDLKTILVNSYKNQTRFLLISDSPIQDRPVEMPPEAYAVPLPEQSTDKLISFIEDAKQEILTIDKKLVESKAFRQSIVDYKKSLSVDIEFENIYSGMGHEESDKTTKLAWISGYVPVDSLKSFTEACKANEWAYACSEPTEDECVPTKLHNNKLVSIIYPLTDFLGTVPGYKEYDISGWFLLFFTLFFAMIFGDAGYGGIITVIATCMIVKSLAKTGKIPSVMWLLFILGIATIGWGIVTCTWFGIAPEKLPSILVNISFAPFSSAKTDGNVVNTNIQMFCFAIGLLQLSIAHIKGMIRNRKSLKCLAELGSMLMLWGMFYVVLDMVVSTIRFPLGITDETLWILDKIPLPFVAIGTLGVGFVLNFIFANYSGNIVQSILESCKNIISVVLGVVNVFSDIVSYIRLWAVALAGSAISNTVNTMAGPLMGKAILFIFAILLLCFGHGLNMILNVLSVIVHGVRLNTLEFSNHLGMTWSGIKYDPFKERNEK